MNESLDFLAKLSSPTSRVLKTKDGEKTYYAKPISAGERAQLLAGQKFMAGPGGGTMEVELDKNESTKHKMVFFSICNEDGSRLFKSPSHAAEYAGRGIDWLYKFASEVNAELPPEETGND